MAARSGRKMHPMAARSFPSGCPPSRKTTAQSRTTRARNRHSMKIELPADVSFHPGPRLMVYRPRGILTEDRLQAAVDFLEKVEDQAAKPFHRFTDLSKLDALDIEFKSIIRISLHRRLTYGQQAPIKSAFYVTSPPAARV